MSEGGMLKGLDGSFASAEHTEDDKWVVFLTVSFCVSGKTEDEAISKARELLQKQIDCEDQMNLLTAEDFMAETGEADPEEPVDGE